MERSLLFDIMPGQTVILSFYDDGLIAKLPAVKTADFDEQLGGAFKPTIAACHRPLLSNHALLM